MKRASVRTARLIPVLLASVFFALLGWRFVRIDGGDTSVRERTVRSRPAQLTLTAPVPQRPGELDSRAASPSHGLAMPVAGADPRTLLDNFSETRGGTRPHGALDIPAPRGTPVLAAVEGVVRKLFTSVPGGKTVYEFDLEERYCYYYAHLDGYAPGLHEGQRLRKGELVGYVGTTGNARKDAPHLHFAVSRLAPDKKWWKGTPVDPYPMLVKAP